MIGKLKTLFAGTLRPPGPRLDERPPMSIEELMGSFPRMVPLRPPSATNDEVMAPVYEVVEEELYQAGMLDRRQA